MYHIIKLLSSTFSTFFNNFLYFFYNSFSQQISPTISYNRFLCNSFYPTTVFLATDLQQFAGSFCDGKFSRLAIVRPFAGFATLGGGFSFFGLSFGSAFGLVVLLPFGGLAFLVVFLFVSRRGVSFRRCSLFFALAFLCFSFGFFCGVVSCLGVIFAPCFIARFLACFVGVFLLAKFRTVAHVDNLRTRKKKQTKRHKQHEKNTK